MMDVLKNSLGHVTSWQGVDQLNEFQAPVGLSNVLFCWHLRSNSNYMLHIS